MRKFNREKDNVEISFLRYEELLLTEQKYDQAIRSMQELGRSSDYVNPKYIRMSLDMLGEDVFLPEKEQ